MNRIKVCVIHSEKMDYNNLIYRKLLSNSTCLSHKLLLPMTKENETKYYKDLIEESDIVVVDCSNPTFVLKWQLKYIKKKVKKPVLYLSQNNIIPKEFRKLVPEVKLINGDLTYDGAVAEFINKSLEELTPKGEVMTLGEI